MSDELSCFLSQLTRGAGTLLAPLEVECKQKSVQELLEGVVEGLHPEDALNADGGAKSWASAFAEGNVGGCESLQMRLWKRDLSPGTRYRLMLKQKKKDKPKKKHYKVRRQEARIKYWAGGRKSTLKYKRSRYQTPQGLVQQYKDYASSKKRTWNINSQELIDILSTQHSDGVELYKKIFNIYRIDKSQGYSIANITIVDRYSLEVLYTPTT